jgi:hypothetical protein
MKYQVAALLVLTALLQSEHLPRPNPTHKTTSELCGITLRAQLTQLRGDLESRLHHPIVCEIANIHSGEGNYASMTIDRQGVPIIKLDQSRGKDETEVAHELFHLKLVATGLETEFRVNLTSDLDTEEVSFIINKFRSDISHRLFYPTMLSMGIDPIKKEKSTWSEFVDSRRPISRNMSHPQAVVNYVGVATERLPADLIDKIDLIYANNGYKNELALGKKIAARIRQTSPKKSSEIAAELVACLEIYYNRKLGDDTIQAVPRHN